MLDPETVNAKLNELKGRDTNRRIFGSDTHDYVLNEPLTPNDVDEFETGRHFKFPEDYRQFIINVGNGGAGPAYGLFKMGEHDSSHSTEPFSKYLVGDLSVNFQFSQAWNLPQEFWDKYPDEDGLSEEEFDDAYEQWVKLLEEAYWSPSIMNGAVPICHLGCAHRDWLIVTGELSGTVWRDNRADEKGIYPLTSDSGKMTTFAEWYNNWLDESLAEVNAKG